MIKPILNRQKLHCCDFSVIYQRPASFSDVLAYYDRFRSYVGHEDDLINSRLTWSLTVHGFLFAVYGLLLGKTADLFVELHKYPDHPLAVEYAVAGLFAFQVPLAICGSLIGYQSSQAIIASHNAIQHLFVIAHEYGVLEIDPAPNRVAGAVTAGPQTVIPSSMDNIEIGARLLIHHPDTDVQEVVRVTTVTGNSFDAEFIFGHRPGASLRPLGSALLPKVISGGDKGAHTGGARSYYLRLPAWATVVWIVLGLISISLAALSMWAPGWFFSFVWRTQ